MDSRKSTLPIDRNASREQSPRSSEQKRASYKSSSIHLGKQAHSEAGKSEASNSTKEKTKKISSKATQPISKKHRSTDSTSEDINLPHVPLLTPTNKSQRKKPSATSRKPQPPNSCDKHASLLQDSSTSHFLFPNHVLCEKCSYVMFFYLSSMRNLMDSMMLEVVSKFLSKPSQCNHCLKEKLARTASESSKHFENFPQQTAPTRPRGDSSVPKSGAKNSEKPHHPDMSFKEPSTEINDSDQFSPVNSNVDQTASENVGNKQLPQAQHHVDANNDSTTTEVPSTTHREPASAKTVGDQNIELDKVASSASIEKKNEADYNNRSEHRQEVDNQESGRTFHEDSRSSIQSHQRVGFKTTEQDETESRLSSPPQASQLLEDQKPQVSQLLENEKLQAPQLLRDENPLAPQPLEDEELQAPQILEDEKPQAFVTVVTNDAQALGAVVMGHSLGLVEASRQSVVVLFGADVSLTLCQMLKEVYHEVLRAPPSAEKRVGLLQDPELGVSFEKLLVWSLEKFSKCVYLDPDTLVIQNCDELFEREELSAVPDNGWPDCFNPGVFVFRPSSTTFQGLVELAQTPGTYDGGEQHVLNVYFQSWKTDLSKKLPFLYNLMASVCYSYKPAFKQFGRNVKIVNFSGSPKPSELQVHPATGQLSPKANVHPSYVAFVRYWLQIFLRRVLPLAPEACQELVKRKELVSPKEVLEEAGIFLMGDTQTMPMRLSIRLRSPRLLSSASHQFLAPAEPEEKKEEEYSEEVDSDADEIEECADVDDEDVEDEEQEEKLADPYMNMQAWEQGRADYMGHDKFDNILKRLDLFIRSAK